MSLPKVGEGRRAEVLLQPDGTVVKLLRDPADAPWLDREEAALRALPGLAPAPRGRATIDARPGLVLERVRGPDLLSLLPRRPWLLPRAAEVMARTHARLHEVRAPPELPDVKDDLRARIEVARELLLPGQADTALAVLDGLPDGDRLCHGDFHLGNVLGTWDEPVVIDWPDAARGDPLADVARTELLHRVAALPPGTSRLAKALIPLGRGFMASRYLKAYGPVDEAVLARWRLVRIAARFGDGLESERPELARKLARAEAAL